MSYSAKSKNPVLNLTDIIRVKPRAVSSGGKRMRGRRGIWGAACSLLLLAAALGACQGTSPSGAGARPRSKLSAGEQDALPFETDISKRQGITSTGGEIEYKACKVTLPVGALDELTFVEVSLTKNPPQDVVPDTPFLISPDGKELNKDALLRLEYRESNIPAGQHEEDLAIVHMVSGVWMEVPNQQVHIYQNSVEAPIRYFGLYALQVRRLDPRTSNALPKAVFEWSFEPYPEASAPSVQVPPDGTGEQAIPPADGSQPPDAGESLPPASGAAVGAGASSGRSGGVTELASAGRTIGERFVVAGPEKEDSGPPAANVAEGDSPGVGKKGKQEEDGLGDSPVPEGEPEEEGLAGVTVYFNASQSGDSDGHVVQYDWDFDCDGNFDFTSHRGPYAKHTFRTNGDYSVALKVTDNGRYPQAGYGTNLVSIRSKNAEAAPLAAHIASYPPSGPCPLTVNFASAVSGGTAPYSYSWEFADGSKSKLPNPFTTYVDIGDRPVKFKVTDVLGETLTGSLVVSPCECDGPPPPQERILLDIDPGTESGAAPLTVSFSFSAERSSGDLTYRVLFGDEADEGDVTVTTSAVHRHTYASSGFYILKVIATDSDLHTGSAFASVNAYPAESARDFVRSSDDPPADVFSWGSDLRIKYDITEASKRTVRFSSESEPKPRGELAFNWDFGDGTYSTDEIARKTFARDGVYEVRLVVSDGLQNWRKRIWLPIGALKPSVAIQSPAFVEGRAPLRLPFDAIVTQGLEPLTFDWSFGESRRSDPSTLFSFASPGEYEVSLKVKDRNGEELTAPKVKIRARSGAAVYRQPMAAIEPANGSTRAAVVGYDGADPLPMSNSATEGAVTLVALSSDGERVAVGSDSGIVVKRIATGIPVLSFMPAAGTISAAAPVSEDAAVCSVLTSSSEMTYLVKQGADPVPIRAGRLLASSGDGSFVVIGARGKSEAALPAALIAISVNSCTIGEPQDLGKVFEAQLTSDGSALWIIDGGGRILCRDLATGREQYFGASEGRRRQLAIAPSGSAAAWVQQDGDQREIIFARLNGADEYELSSVTALTGLFSDYFQVSADGRYLLTYGSRKKLAQMLAAKKGKPVNEDEIMAQSVTGVPRGPLPPDRERFGIIRLDLAGDSKQWTLESVRPRFVIEAGPEFSNAGPF